MLSELGIWLTLRKGNAEELMASYVSPNRKYLLGVRRVGKEKVSLKEHCSKHSRDYLGDSGLLFFNWR